MHSCQEKHYNQCQQEGVITDNFEELRCCMQLLLLGHSILSEHSHMDEANEVSLETCLIKHDNDGSSCGNGHIMQQSSVDIVQQNCCEYKEVQANPVNECLHFYPMLL